MDSLKNHTVLYTLEPSYTLDRGAHFKLEASLYTDSRLNHHSEIRFSLGRFKDEVSAWDFIHIFENLSSMNNYVWLILTLLDTGETVYSAWERSSKKVHSNKNIFSIPHTYERSWMNMIGHFNSVEDYNSYRAAKTSLKYAKSDAYDRAHRAYNAIDGKSGFCSHVH